MEINDILEFVKHKNKYKATTTLKFKRDIIDVLLGNDFEGDILEVGVGNGDTTVILCKIAEILHKKVYAYDIVQGGLDIAKEKCKQCGLNNCEFIKIDVYKEEWKVKSIGCVFVDCLHTKEFFLQDLKNVEKIILKDGIIILHDYGLLNIDGTLIADILKENPDKYKIIRVIGQRRNWNILGSGKVVDWEGVQISIL